MLNNNNIVLLLSYIYDINTDILLDKYNATIVGCYDKYSYKDNCILFKKISLMFTALKYLLKCLITKIDSPNYQRAISEDINFPQSIDQLILLVGTFNDAFDDVHTKLLYDIIDFHHYSDFLSISCINNELIPFVADGDINMEKLINDFNEFKLISRNFICYVLDLNIKFEPSIISKII